MNNTRPLLSDAELEAKLGAQTLPRVTMDHIQSRVVKTDYLRHGLLTVCVLKLANGFTVTGESACVDAGNYNPAIGDKIAHDNAIQKIWPLEGYLLAEKRFEQMSKFR